MNYNYDTSNIKTYTVLVVYITARTPRCRISILFCRRYTITDTAFTLIVKQAIIYPKTNSIDDSWGNEKPK